MMNKGLYPFSEISIKIVWDNRYAKMLSLLIAN